MNKEISLPAAVQKYADDKEFVREWLKMKNGELYDAVHPNFQALLLRTRKLVREFNDAQPDDDEKMHNIARELFGSLGKDVHINQPLRVDYGCNIFIGDGTFINFNFTVLDEADVTIGRNVFIGPNVSMYCACHPTDPDERRNGAEWALPVTIGNDVWIGGGATILPGVTIGDGAVIAAGAVVSRSIPPRMMAAGVPARVVRPV